MRKEFIVTTAVYGFFIAWAVYMLVGMGAKEEVSSRIEVPAVRLDLTGISGDSEFEKPYVLRSDWFSRNIPLWKKALEDYRGKPNLRYLEVGVFEGRSFFWMLENVLTDPTCQLVGIDTFDDSEEWSAPYRGYKEVFFENIELSGAKDRIDVRIGYSRERLRELPFDSFDLIYVDASHFPRDCLEDAIQSWPLLKEGGMVIFDDYSLLSSTGELATKKAIDTFYEFFGDNIEVIHCGYQAIFRKKPNP